jgi:hypothetical protein
MEPLQQPEGEFHHFQLIGPDGQVPLSISVLLHVNRAAFLGSTAELSPIGTDDVIALHDALRTFDGNFIKAFQKK